jgi:hypothetical protein
MSRARLLRSAVACLCLVVLGGGPGLPVLEALLADEPAPFCCGKGRCCCARELGDRDDGRPCLSTACGCGGPDAATVGAPLRFEAVLPVVAPAAADPLVERPTARRAERPLTRPGEPPVPPPRAPRAA